MWIGFAKLISVDSLWEFLKYNFIFQQKKSKYKIWISANFNILIQKNLQFPAAKNYTSDRQRSVEISLKHSHFVNPKYLKWKYKLLLSKKISTLTSLISCQSGEEWKKSTMGKKKKKMSFNYMVKLY